MTPSLQGQAANEGGPIAEDIVTGTLRFETAGAIIATAIAGVAAVWLTGDPRAFGVIVVFAGLLFGVAVGRQEWRTSRPHPGTGPGSRASAGTDVTRAA
jgi:hypothetical protein